MNYVNQKSLEDLDRLRARLLQTDKWPIRYMFKFIAPNNEMILRDLLAAVPPNGQTKVVPSKGQRYVVVTHVNTMYSPDDIIKFTIRATSIEGVTAL